jgi:D-amino-acid dehydrogenase
MLSWATTSFVVIYPVISQSRDIDQRRCREHARRGRADVSDSFKLSSLELPTSSWWLSQEAVSASGIREVPIGLAGKEVMSGAPSRRTNSPALGHVVVVGAGMVGLATAWFLQEYGVEVTVIDREGIAAGASWGNAGWLSPGIVTPLAEPSVLRYGLKAFFDPAAALYIPPTIDPGLWRFLTRFAMHCTMKQWKRSMEAYVEIDRQALSAFDDLANGGVTSPTIDAPLMVAFEHARDASGFRHELELIRHAGQPVDVDELSRADAGALMAHIADRMELVLQLNGQRYVDSGEYVNSLADSVVAKGGTIRKGMCARTISRDSSGIAVELEGADPVRGDAVVVAVGSWLNDLAPSLGVRTRVQSGRGYSFSVSTGQPVRAPIYVPAARLACTPYRGGMRIGGSMEFRSVDAPLDPTRVDAIVKAAKPVLSGVDWESISDVWVGSRPVTADSRPLIGATKVAGVFVAGGHGMFGMTLGAVTGKLLAEQMITGNQPGALRAFGPLR